MPPFTDSDFTAAIRDSGFPFELEVAASLQSAGFEVSAWRQFFSKARQKELEVDILATRRSRLSSSVGNVDATLQLVVECKNFLFPYVLFGLPYSSRAVAGGLDLDVRYLAIDSTEDDDVPNKLALMAFRSRSDSASPRPSHHQFNTSDSFVKKRKRVGFFETDRSRTSGSAGRCGCNAGCIA